jgi:hypothetical protein
MRPRSSPFSITAQPRPHAESISFRPSREKAVDPLLGHPDGQIHVCIEGLQHAIQLINHDVNRLMISASGVEP